MNLKEIEQLVDIVRDARVSELEVSVGDATVKLRKPLPPAPPRPKPKAAQAKPTMTTQDAPVEPAPAETFVTSPMVGIFRGSAGAVSVGGFVKQGQVVGVIESMKLMNDVVSELEGEVAEILVDDDMPVEFGQKLIRLKSE